MTKTAQRLKSPLKAIFLSTFKKRLSIAISSYVAYILAFKLLEAATGPAAGIFITAPVLMTAWMFGLRGGVAAGLITFPLNIALVEAFTSRSAIDSIFSGGLAGGVAEVVVGALVGRIRDLARHLSEEVRKLKETEDEIAVADEVSRIVTSTLEIGVVYERFANEVKKLVDWDMMNISIMDDEAGQAVAQYFYGEASEHLQAGFKSPIPGTLAELVRDEGRTVIVKDGEFRPEP